MKLFFQAISKFMLGLVIEGYREYRKKVRYKVIPYIW